MKPTVGLVVEGRTEYTALPFLHSHGLVKGCPPLKPLTVNGIGSQRKPHGIATLLAPKVREHLAAGRMRVVVCFDREDREPCAPELASAVLASLRRVLEPEAARVEPWIHVVVADRSFEAWLLADARGLHERGVFKTKPGFHRFEGELGAQRRLGALELEGLLGQPYRKARDGPRLWASIDFAPARLRDGHGSRSLDKLLRTLRV